MQISQRKVGLNKSINSLMLRNHNHLENKNLGDSRIDENGLKNSGIRDSKG